MAIEFTKMHGLGNDFVVVDGITQRVQLEPGRIAELADRHTGIGFDQLLVVEAPDHPDADFRYRIHNADGTEAPACGNGARCFARFVLDQGLTVKPELVLQTLAGELRCRVDGEQVEVEMGEPVFEPSAVPFLEAHARTDGESSSGAFEIDVGGQAVAFTPVSIGNPHAVILVGDVTGAPVERVGPALQEHPSFPESVNVGFCEVVDRGFVRLRVFERGVGETRACGTGACAAAAAAIRAGLADARVKVSLPGGKLWIGWQGPGHAITMTGPTAVAFRGRIET